MVHAAGGVRIYSYYTETMSESFSSPYPDEVEHTEKPLTKEEVIAALDRHVQNYTVQRELSDAEGVYIFEVIIPGEKEGEVTEYTYQRKGVFGTNQSSTTTVSVAYYEDGMPVGGKTLANYDEKTGLWK